MDATQSSQVIPPVPQRKVKHTILFLAANPLGIDQLALDREARAIQEELERTGCRNQFEFVTRWAVQAMDLLRELRRLKPTVVHFCGSGGSDGEHDGLFFHGPDGYPQFVSTEALEETFSAAGASVRVVVLGGCHSDVQAAVLVSHVGCVVGLRARIRDATASAFAVGFYGGLGEGESVAMAFRQGKAAIHLDQPEHGAIPLALLTSPGIDAGSLYITHQPKRKTRCSIVIKATLDEFDANAIARVRDELRSLTGDVLLEIIEVQEGSVRLTILLSAEAAARLSELSDGGKLGSLIGLEVSGVHNDGVIDDERLPEEADPDRDRSWHELGETLLENHRRQAGAERRSVDFTGAMLNGANFSWVNLRRADFFGAHLARAKLAHTSLTGAMLGLANLAETDLTGANLVQANLIGANLARADLRGANLIEVSLVNANLARANLHGAKLRQADLRWAQLFRADLRGVNLIEANLGGADLAGADLTEANLRGADLTGANLRGVDLTRADLIDAVLRAVTYDGATKWPDRFDPRVLDVDDSKSGSSSGSAGVA